MDRMLDMLKTAEENDRNSTMAAAAGRSSTTMVAANRSTLPPGPRLTFAQLKKDQFDSTQINPGLHGLMGARDNYNRADKLRTMKYHDKIHHAWKLAKEFVKFTQETPKETGGKHGPKILAKDENGEVLIKACCCVFNSWYFNETNRQMYRELNKSLQEVIDCRASLLDGKITARVPLVLLEGLEAIHVFLRKRCAMSPVDNLVECFRCVPHDGAHLSKKTAIFKEYARERKIMMIMKNVGMSYEEQNPVLSDDADFIVEREAFLKCANLMSGEDAQIEI